MAYLIRVRLPDRPGSLGTLAVALGSVEADILGVDVVERGPDGAVDDIVVELPRGAQPERLVVAAQATAGTSVIAVQPYPLGLDIHRELDLLEDVAADPAQAVAYLVEHAPMLFRAGWAMTLEQTDGGAPTIAKASPSAPAYVSEDGSALPWFPPDKPVHLDGSAPWVPTSWQRLSTDLVAAPIGAGGCALLIGRPGGPPFLDSEILRVGHMASLVGTVAGAEGP